MTDCSVDLVEKITVAFPFTTQLEKSELRYLGQLVEWQYAKAGECLWCEGDLDDRLGFVVQGGVKLLKETAIPGCLMTLGLFGAGSLVADLSFVQGNPRATAAYAVGDLRMVFLPRKRLQQLIIERPQLGSSIYNAVLVSADEQLRDMYGLLNNFF